MSALSVPRSEPLSVREHPGEPLGEKADEKSGGEPHDVQIVALDPLDEGGAGSLDRIAAGAPLPFAQREVGSDLAVGERAEDDRCRLVLDDLPLLGAETQARDDLVRLPRKGAEHRPRGRRVSGLAEDAAFEDDRRIDAEDESLRRHGARLAAGVLVDEHGRVRAGRIALLVAGPGDRERDAELLEDRPPLRGGGGQRQPLRRATQISSEGQLRAHSGSGSSGNRVGSAPAGACTSTSLSTVKPVSQRSRIQSPCARWNSTESSLSGHSRRFMPKSGRSSSLPGGPSSGMQRIDTIPFVRKTSRPPGRRSRAASGIHRNGSNHKQAPYSERARSKLASGSGTFSASPCRSGNSSPCSRWRARAVPSCFSELSIPTGRAPARASQADQYAVPQPSSTTSMPATSGSTCSSL